METGVKKNKMGSWLSYFRGGKSAELDPNPALDEPDPKCGLTEREKRVIVENWAPVRENLRENGADFFLALFKAHPSYQKQFKSLATLKPDELRVSKKLIAHGTDVMYSITAMVDNLDDVEVLSEQLLRTGENHVRRKVNAEQFEGLGILFVKFLKEKLGNKFTPFAEKAWEKLWVVMVKLLKQGLEKGKA